MSKPGTKQLVLIGLIVVLGLTLYFGLQMNRTPDLVAVQAQGKRSAAVASGQADAKIRLDLLDKASDTGDIGKKNLFQYGPPPAPPAPATPPAPPVGPSISNPAATSPRPPVAPPAPPPPPPVPLKYVGFASVEPNSKTLIATLIDDSQHHFNAVEGDVFMGRYRVARITDTAVDIEDLEFTRRQTLPLVKQ